MTHTGASLRASGGKCKSSEFSYRKKHVCKPEEALRISGLPTVKYEDIPDIDDQDKYEWHEFLSVKQVRKGEIKAGWPHGEPEDRIVTCDSKYGRSMYCPKTGIKRSQTMGEFYGGGVVD